MKTMEKILKEFDDNFRDDGKNPKFDIEEAKIWLRVDIQELVKDTIKQVKSAIPNKISEKEITKEIKKSKLDDDGKQRVRAKNYGYNLAIKDVLDNLKIILTHNNLT